jgi:hypothetical protein
MQVEAFTQIKIFKCIQWPIGETSYFKLEHHDKWKTLSAFNSPIDECIFWMMLLSCKSFINKKLECIQLVNKWS